MKKLLSLIILGFLSHCCLMAQEDTLRVRYGAYGGVNYNLHSADFYKLKGIPNCCPEFESGTGIGFNAGLLFEMPLNSSLLLGGKLGFMAFNGELSKTEPTTIILETELTPGEFTHTMEGLFGNIGLEPYVSYNLWKGLFVAAGIRAGVNVNADYDQKEEITKPEGAGTFLDSLGNDTHSRIRNGLDGEIPDAASFIAHAFAGVSWELPLNKNGTLFLAPELYYYVGLNEFVTDTDWKVSSLRGSIALKFSPKPKHEIIEEYREEYEIDTIRISKEGIEDERIETGVPSVKTIVKKTDRKVITTEIIIRTDTLFYSKSYLLKPVVSAAGMDSLGNEIKNPVFKIEEFETKRYDPLLNYIFFAEKSAELPPRYRLLSSRETEQFTIDSLNSETTIGIYYNILNIIGRRLLKNPEAGLNIVGCNSNIGGKKENIELSKKRAESVRKYLANVWGIDKNRLNTEARNLPEKASSPIHEQEKAAENRRVELYSDNQNIIQPVFIETIERTANPPVIIFKPEAESEAGIKSWKLTASQKSMSLENEFLSSGTGDLPEIIDWKLENFQKIIPRHPEPVYYSLEITDKKGNTETAAEKTLPIEVISVKKKRKEKIGDYEIERFSLILFDFDKADIEDRNQEIINFIKSRTKPGSIVTIKGYTDRTGDDDYNLRLSERRADAAKKSLGIDSAEAQGMGEEILLYDNDSPEGRFYCRTVEITVKTKVE